MIRLLLLFAQSLLVSFAAAVFERLLTAKIKEGERQYA